MWKRRPRGLVSSHRTLLNFGLSEIILALHQGNYNGPYLKPPMDLWSNRDRPIKIQRREEAAPFLLHAMSINPDHWSAIGRLTDGDGDSRNDARSRPLIAINRFIQRLQFNFVSLRLVLRDGRRCSRNFFNYSLYTTPNRVPFVREHSRLISVSIECLRSRFNWKRRENLHLELHLRLQKFGMNSLASGDLLDHFEGYFGLVWVNSS